MNHDIPSHRYRWLVFAAAIIVFSGVFAEFPVPAARSPVTIAVFDFELNDFSAGAGAVDTSAADQTQLNRTTDEARSLLGGSGLYSLVDVSKADAEAVKHCGGCEAAIARKLGAEESFLGVVSRISRVEYVVRFRVRDTSTGNTVLAAQSGLRLGADYSWYLGAAALIDDHLLNRP